MNGKIEQLEKRIAFLESRLSLSSLDEAEYWRAIRALNNGNMEPLNNFLKRGGVIPVTVKGERKETTR